MHFVPGNFQIDRPLVKQCDTRRPFCIMRYRPVANSRITNRVGEPPGQHRI